MSFSNRNIPEFGKGCRIQSVPARGTLYGIGFALYALALIHPVKELFAIVRNGLQKHELA